jgi:hypothetical protein
MVESDEKAYLVGVISGERFETYLLTGAHVEGLFGLKCVKGTYHASKSHWMNGTEMFIPLDKIKSVNVFPSLKASCDAVQGPAADRG